MNCLEIGSNPLQQLGAEGEGQGEIGFLQTKRSSPLVPLFSENISQFGPQESISPPGQTTQAGTLFGHVFGAPNQASDLIISQLDSFSPDHGLLSSGKHQANIYPSHPSFEPLQPSDSQYEAAASQCIGGANQIPLPASHTNTARLHQEHGTLHQIGQLTPQVSKESLKAHRLETRASNRPLASVKSVGPLPVIVPKRGRGRPRGLKKSAAYVIKSHISPAENAEKKAEVGIDVNFQGNLKQQQAATQNLPTLPFSQKRKPTSLETQTYQSVPSATRPLKRRKLNTVRFALETEFHEPALFQVSSGHEKASPVIQFESKIPGHAPMAFQQVRAFLPTGEVRLPDQFKALDSVPNLSMNFSQAPHQTSALASVRVPEQSSVMNILRSIFEDGQTLNGVTAQAVAQAYKQVSEVEALLRKSIAQKDLSDHPGLNLHAPSELIALQQIVLQKAQYISAKFTNQLVKRSCAAESTGARQAVTSPIQMTAPADPTSPSAKSAELKAVDSILADAKIDARAASPRNTQGRAVAPLFQEPIAHKTAELKKQNAGKLKWLELSFGVAESELPPQDSQVDDADYFAKYMC